MSDYAVVFTRSARKELEALPRTISQKIISTIEALQKEARPKSARKLMGSDDLWRARVGDYRVVYAVDDRRRLVDIRAVRHRKDAYR